MAKRVMVTLNGGNVLVSEDMSEADAQAEVERIMAEDPANISQGTHRTIKVGKSGAFKSSEFIKVELIDA